MATYRGTDGVIQFASEGWSAAVGWNPALKTLVEYIEDGGADISMTNVQSFALSAAAAPINDNTLGDQWDTHLVGRNSLTGSIAWLYDYSADWLDLTEIARVVNTNYLGRTLWFDVYPADYPSLRITGKGTITGIEVSNNHDNTALTLTAQITATGADWGEDI